MHCSKIKEVVQERLFLFMGMVFVVVMVIILVAIPFVIGLVVFFFRIMVGRPFHDLVQFSPVQPDAAAVGAIIDFYSLLVADQQGGVAIGAFHSLKVLKMNKIRFELLFAWGPCVYGPPVKK
jgi:hypothetical protein